MIFAHNHADSVIRSGCVACGWVDIPRARLLNAFSARAEALASEARLPAAEADGAITIYPRGLPR